MKFIIFFLLFSIVVEKVVAQDERYYRDLFLKRDDQLDAKKETVYDIRARTPLYQFDLNGDGIKEGIVFEKAGGESNLHIYSHTKKLLRKYSFDVKGKNAGIYKIQLKRLSPISRVMIVHFFEGAQNYTEYNATARLYFISLDKGKLSTLKMFKGPVIWHEFRDGRLNYHRRKYEVGVSDLNSDGFKEILVKFSNLSRVYFYDKGGNWKTF